MNLDLFSFYFFVSVVLYFVLANNAFGKLTLTTAGQFSSDIIALSDGSTHTVCKNDHPQGFNVRCDGQPTDNFADFLINEKKFRTERAMPYYLAGDVNGVPKTWSEIPNTASIMCVTNSITYRATVVFSCVTESQKPTSTITSLPSPLVSPLPKLLPGMMYAVAAGRNPASTAIMINNGSQICSREELGTKSYSIVCGGDSAIKWARFIVNGVIVQQDKLEPYTVTKSWKSGKFAPWREAPLKPFSISCMLSNGVQNTITNVSFKCIKSQKPPPLTPSPSFEADTRLAAGCVNIETKKVDVLDGWEKVENGVAFRPNNFETSLSEPGSAALSYKFTVRFKSKYAVVVDMTTFGDQNYNDIWMQLAPGDLQITSFARTENAMGWIKVFHKEDGRSTVTKAKSTFVGSLSSSDSLVPEREYTISISGRSNRVIVHEIVLFPCSEGTCYQSEWIQTQKICLPNFI